MLASEHAESRQFSHLGTTQCASAIPSTIGVVAITRGQSSGHPIGLAIIVLLASPLRDHTVATAIIDGAIAPVVTRDASAVTADLAGLAVGVCRALPAGL